MQAAHIAGGDAFDGTVFIEQHFGSGKTRVYLHTQRLGLLAEPATDIAQRNHLIALIVKAAGQQAVRYLGGTGFGEDEEPVFGHRRIERGTVFLPVW